jgi:hypothetical protein
MTIFYQNKENLKFANKSVRPRQLSERRLLRLAHFHCAFCTPPPPSAQGEGGGRSVSKLKGNIGEHQVCSPSTVSSLWKVVHLEQHHQVHLVRGTFYTFERMLLVTPCSQPNLPSTEGSVVTA